MFACQAPTTVYNLIIEWEVKFRNRTGGKIEDLNMR